MFEKVPSTALAPNGSPRFFYFPVLGDIFHAATQPCLRIWATDRATFAQDLAFCKPGTFPTFFPRTFRSIPIFVRDLHKQLVLYKTVVY